MIYVEEQSLKTDTDAVPRRTFRSRVHLAKERSARV